MEKYEKKIRPISHIFHFTQDGQISEIIGQHLIAEIWHNQLKVSGHKSEEVFKLGPF